MIQSSYEPEDSVRRRVGTASAAGATRYPRSGTAPLHSATVIATAGLNFKLKRPRVRRRAVSAHCQWHRV